MFKRGTEIINKLYNITLLASRIHVEMKRSRRLNEKLVRIHYKRKQRWKIEKLENLK